MCLSLKPAVVGRSVIVEQPLREREALGPLSEITPNPRPRHHEMATRVLPLAHAQGTGGRHKSGAVPPEERRDPRPIERNAGVVLLPGKACAASEGAERDLRVPCVLSSR